jgi:hypothetical protein
MANKTRPIRILIPEELGITENEKDHLNRAFQLKLQDVVEPGDLGPLVGNPINTTRPPVEIEVIGRPMRASRKSAKKRSEKSAKKAAGKSGRKR